MRGPWREAAYYVSLSRRSREPRKCPPTPGHLWVEPVWPPSSVSRAVQWPVSWESQDQQQLPGAWGWVPTEAPPKGPLSARPSIPSLHTH